MKKTTAKSRNKNSSISYFAQMLTPGQILRSYREKQKILLIDVSEETKIPLDQLKKIEADDFADKDGQVFMRGFIKNYSDYLGLNTERILAIYRRTAASQMEREKKVKKKFSLPKFKLEFTPATVVSGIFTLVVLTILVYLGIQLYNFQQPPQLTVLTPLNNSVVQSDMIEMKGLTEEFSVVKINEEVVSIDSAGNFTTEIKLNEGVNTIVVKSYKNNNEDKATVIPINVTYEKLAEQPADESVPVEETAKSTIQIKIQGAPTWITLNIDGKQEIAQVLNEGDTSVYEFADSFSMVTGKPETTTVLVDGESRQVSVNYSTGSSTLSCERISGVVTCE